MQTFSMRLTHRVNAVLQNAWIVVFAVTLIGLYPRLDLLLSGRSLWADEAFVYWMAQGTLEEVLDNNATGNSAPPLYVILVHLVSAGVGDSEVTLRCISFIPGLLSIPVTYILMRQYVDKFPAYVGALMVAVSDTQIKYSQELREYTFSFLIAALLLISYHRFRDYQTVFNWLLLTATISLAILTQYGLALFIFALNAIVGIELLANSKQINRRFILGWVGTQVIGLITVLIVYQLALTEQFSSGGFGANGYLARGYWDGSISSMVTLAFKNTYKLLELSFQLSSVLVLMGALGFLYVLNYNSARVKILLIVFIPIIIVFLAGILSLYPYIGERQNIFLIPVILLLSVCGFQWLFEAAERNVLLSMPVFTLVVMGVIGFMGLYEALSVKGMGPQHIKPLVKQVSNSLEPGDRIYVGCNARFAFRYYYEGDDEDYIVRVADYSIEEAQGHLDEVLEQTPGDVWLIFTQCLDDEKQKIIDHAKRSGYSIELVDEEIGAWLYVSQRP